MAHDDCPGRPQALYVRKGAAGTWTKVGEICLECMRIWPLEQPKAKRRGGKR